MPTLKHTVSLSVTVAALWVLLSGHFSPLLLGFGLLSTALTVFLALRMEVVDHESYPFHLTWRLLGYWLWLGREVVKSNIAMAAIILHPRLPISPTLLRVPARGRSALGRTILANSITLSPGTVTLDVTEDELKVHAFTRELAEELKASQIHRRAPDIGARR